MLPKDLLSLTAHDRETTPRYLTTPDEPWVADVASELASWARKTIGERASGLKLRAPMLAAEHGVAARLVDGLAYVLSRTYASEIACRREPIEVRAVTFEESARGLVADRGTALSAASSRLDLAIDEIESGLFADRHRARRIVAPLVPATIGEAMDAFNLALVQGLLASSARIVVDLDADAHDAIRLARRAGLICTSRTGEQRLRLDVSGPLSILRHTAKYGRLLARFLPALLGRAEFRVEAHCVIRSETMVVVIASCDPLFRHATPFFAGIPSPHALAQDADRLATFSHAAATDAPMGEVG